LFLIGNTVAPRRADTRQQEGGSQGDADEERA
jgi:hypothetical protein